MFEDSLAISDATTRAQSRWTIAASFAAQAAIAATLIAFPLLHPAMLTPRAYDITLARPVPPPPPAPPPPRVRLVETSHPTEALSAPANTREPIIPHSEPASGPAPVLTTNLLMSNPAATSFPITLGPASTSPAISIRTSIPATNAAHKSPTAISSGVSAALLLAPIRPQYPPIALAAHQQGTVTVQALISKSGEVESAHATSGPAMLQASAVEAVRRARYRPFLLNGQPTEVDASFTIHFTLSSE